LEGPGRQDQLALEQKSYSDSEGTIGPRHQNRLALEQELCRFPKQLQQWVATGERWRSCRCRKPVGKPGLPSDWLNAVPHTVPACRRIEPPRVDSLAGTTVGGAPCVIVDACSAVLRAYEKRARAACHSACAGGCDAVIASRDGATVPVDPGAWRASCPRKPAGVVATAGSRLSLRLLCGAKVQPPKRQCANHARRPASAISDTSVPMPL
jgi:hypothetical protein